MSAAPEDIWKQRFISRLAQLFVQRGIDADSALADAEAHADACYARRGGGVPEQEADAEYRRIQIDSFEPSA